MLLNYPFATAFKHTFFSNTYHTCPVQLPAHFTVWLASPEAAFLNGRSVWANWDVDELKAKAEAIQQSQLFTAGINGWPFTP